MALSSISLMSPNPWDLLEGPNLRWQLGLWKEWGWQGRAVQTPGSAGSLSGSQLGCTVVSRGAPNGPHPTPPHPRPGCSSHGLPHVSGLGLGGWIY